MADALGGHLVGEGGVARHVGAHGLGKTQPAEPVGQLRQRRHRPDRMVLRPDARREAVAGAPNQPGRHVLAGLADRNHLAVEARHVQRPTLGLERRDQQVVRTRERGDAVTLQRRGDGVQIDADRPQPPERLARRRHALVHGGPHAAVVAERLDRLGRHRVDRVGTDQLLDVEHVPVGGVLGARAGPQRTLHAAPARAQAGERRAVEDLAEALVDDLRCWPRRCAREAPGPPGCRSARARCPPPCPRGRRRTRRPRRPRPAARTARGRGCRPAPPARSGRARTSA